MKKKFIVVRREVWVSGVAIEAESPEEALTLVRDGAGEEVDSLLEYSHTLDSDTWTVDSAEGEPLI